MKKLLLLLTFLSTTAFALIPAEISQQLQQYKEVKGDFQQERYLSGMTQPIISTGTFIFSQQQELIWQMEKPFPSRLEVNRKGIKQSFGDNKIPAAGSTNINQTQVKLLLALIGGDVEMLAEYFEVKAAGTVEKWTLTLLPTHAFLQQIFRQIRVEGGQFVNSVQLQELQGDITILTFHHQSVKI